MHLRVVPRDSLDDGWMEPDIFPRGSSEPWPGTPRVGDTVLYEVGTQRTPAVLVEAAGGNSWLARDARHAHDLIYLGAESIVARLPRTDLLEEAA